MIPEISAEKLRSRSFAQDLLAKILDGNYNQEQLIDVLTLLKSMPLNAEGVLGFRDAIMAHAENFEIVSPCVIDICGTGGDGKNTFNVSTLAALTVAACGFLVAKHGNSASSSSSGSSDILRVLDIPLPTNADEAQRQIAHTGITFLHAPYFHPALAALGAARKKFGAPTVFNILGPLCHPAQPTVRVLGTAKHEVYHLYCEILPVLGGAYAIIQDENGYDEISLTGPARICINGTETIFMPADFGLSPLRSDDLISAVDMAENKNLFLTIASGQGSTAQNAVVAANAALAMHLVESAQAIIEHFKTAQKILQNGRVFTLIEKLRDQA